MRYCPVCGTRAEDHVSFCPHDGTPTEVLPEAAPQGADPLLGRVVDGRYRVEQQIGEGGMGIVYMATHTVLNKKLALKVLRADMSRDQDTVQRFMQEAQAATSIGHENIIDISDFGRLPDGSAYFVMEYCEGQELTRLIARGGSVPVQEALHIIVQIASALSAAHKRGIVHRDLKPDNVFLTQRGDTASFVKVLDFGIAKVGGAGSKLTKTGMVFGTPHYMSPEQAAGQAIDARTDIYALGVIMYEMFTGRVPFDAETFMGILSKHMFEAPEPPSRANSQLGALEDIILKALSKKAEHRYQEMDELIQDLRSYSSGGMIQLGGRAGLAPPTGLADALEPISRTEANLLVSPDDLTPPGRSPVLYVALALVALLVAGGGIGGAYAMGLFERGQDLPPAPDPTEEPTLAVNVVPEPIAPEASAEATSPEPDAPDPEVRMTRILSEPTGAQVVVGGAIVGNTPVRVPLPEGSDSRDLTIRLRRYEPEQVRLTAASPEEIVLTLRSESTRSRRVGSRPTKRRPVVTAAPPPPTPPPPPTKTVRQRPVIRSEVVDPWAR